MSLDPFSQIIRTVRDFEKNFGGKPYTDIQLNIIEEHCARVPHRVFMDALKSFTESNRYKPLPIDFKNAFASYHAQNRQNAAPEDYQIKCRDCMDIGIAFLDADTEADIVAKCHCDLGESRTEKFGRITHRGQVRDFPNEKFKPDQGVDGIWGKVTWWKGVLAISEMYWDDQTKKDR